jgi:uncharacterized protein (TIGR00730 family)
MTVKKNRICVFCGSGSGRSARYLQVAQDVGREIAQRKMTLVYGAGPTGMMGAVADATWDHGGDVIGVLPRMLAERKEGRSDRIDLRLVDDMNERKALMADLSDGFIVLPGGLGTYDELFEMLTWSQLRFHDKPTVIVNIDGHFDLLIKLLDQAVETGFVQPEHRSLAMITSSVADAVEIVTGGPNTSHRAPQPATAVTAGLRSNLATRRNEPMERTPV